MRYLVSVSAVLVTVLVASFLMTGCGSDDDPVSTKAPAAGPFSGSYRYIQMTGLALNITDPFRSETGVFTTVREDSVRFQQAFVTQGGTSQGPIDPPDRSLEIRDDRGVAITDPGGFIMQGRFTPDGSVAVFQTELAASHMGFLMVARQNTSPAQDDLAGKWFLVQYGAGPATAPATGMAGFAAVGGLEVDASGTVTFFDYDYNKGGVVNPNFVIHLPAQLIPDGAGGVMWQRLTGSVIEFRGGLSEDGNLVLLGSIDGFGGEGGIRILIRAGLITNQSDLNGKYFATGFTLLNAPIARGPYPMFGEMALGGSGVGTWDCTFPPPTNSPLTINYTVDLDTKVAVTHFMGPLLWGWSGPGGDYSIMTGPFQSGVAEPWFQATVR